MQHPPKIKNILHLPYLVLVPKIPARTRRKQIIVLVRQDIFLDGQLHHMKQMTQLETIEKRKVPALAGNEFFNLFWALSAPPLIDDDTTVVMIVHQPLDIRVSQNPPPHLLK